MYGGPDGGIMYRAEEIKEWARDRQIYAKSTAHAQAVCALEEVTELVKATLAGDDKLAIQDAIGDVYVTLVNTAEMARLDMESCVDLAVNTIINRTGKMNAAGKFEKDGEAA